MAAVIGIALLLFGISAFVFLRAKRQPYLVTGWLWYLGTLVPTIGLIQVGPQSMADRYMYIPSIGLFLVLTWGLTDLVAALQRRFHAAVHRARLRLTTQLVPSAITGACLLACFVGTRAQIRYWHDGTMLYGHAVEVDARNYIAHDYLGVALAHSGRKEEAISCFTQAVRLRPKFAEARYNLGTLLLEKGQIQEALINLKAAVEATPWDAKLHYNLANAYLQLDQLPQATAALANAAGLKPDNLFFRLGLASVLIKDSRFEEAAILLFDILRVEPGNVAAHRNLAVALVNQGKRDEALSHFAEAVRLEPRRSGCPLGQDAQLRMAVL